VIYGLNTSTIMLYFRIFATLEYDVTHVAPGALDKIAQRTSSRLGAEWRRLLPRADESFPPPPLVSTIDARRGANARGGAAREIVRNC